MADCEECEASDVYCDVCQNPVCFDHESAETSQPGLNSGDTVCEDRASEC
jgi:hypothetical protein